MLWYVRQQNHNAGQGNDRAKQDIREILSDHQEGSDLLFQVILESRQILIESKQANKQIQGLIFAKKKSYLLWIRINWFQSNVDIWETFS